MGYKITNIWDDSINNVHHITVEYNRYSYSVIFGKYVNGGFCSIPNFGVGCELSNFNDIFWNTESLYRALENKRVAKIIANAIADFAEFVEKGK